MTDEPNTAAKGEDGELAKRLDKLIGGARVRQLREPNQLPLIALDEGLLTFFTRVAARLDALSALEAERDRLNQNVIRLEREIDRRGAVVEAVQNWRQRREWEYWEDERHESDTKLKQIIDGYSRETLRQDQGAVLQPMPTK